MKNDDSELISNLERISGELGGKDGICVGRAASYIKRANEEKQALCGQLDKAQYQTLKLNITIRKLELYLRSSGMAEIEQ